MRSANFEESQKNTARANKAARAAQRAATHSPELLPSPGSDTGRGAHVFADIRTAMLIDTCESRNTTSRGAARAPTGPNVTTHLVDRGGQFDTPLAPGEASPGQWQIYDCQPELQPGSNNLPTFFSPPQASLTTPEAAVWTLAPQQGPPPANTTVELQQCLLAYSSQDPVFGQPPRASPPQLDNGCVVGAEILAQHAGMLDPPQASEPTDDVIAVPAYPLEPPDTLPPAAAKPPAPAPVKRRFSKDANTSSEEEVDCRTSRRRPDDSESSRSSDSDGPEEPGLEATTALLAAARLRASYADVLTHPRAPPPAKRLGGTLQDDTEARSGPNSKRPAAPGACELPTTHSAPVPAPRKGKTTTYTPATGANKSKIGPEMALAPKNANPGRSQHAAPKPPAPAKVTASSGKGTAVQQPTSTKRAAAPHKAKAAHHVAPPPATPAVDAAAPTPGTAPATTTWTNTKCEICPTGPLRDDTAVLQHFLEVHSVDGYSMVNDASLQAHGLAACPDCGKTFKAGLVHHKDKCRLTTYRSSAKYLSSRKAFMLNTIKPKDIPQLPPADLLTPEYLFGSATGRCNDLRTNRLLQEDLRVAFIIAVRAIKLASSDAELTASWTWLLQLPTLALPLRCNEADLSKHLRLLLSGGTEELIRDLQFKNAMRKALPDQTLDDESIALRATKLLIATGNIGKTADRLLQPAKPLNFDLETAPLVHQLLTTDNDMQPTAPLPTSTPQIPTLDEDTIKWAIRSSSNSAPAITGWSAALIKIVSATQQGLQAVTTIANKLFSKDVPVVIMDGLRRQRLLLLSKHPKPGVRPVLISDAWIRLVETCVTSEIPQLAYNMQPLQMAVGAPSGADDIIHLSRAALEADNEAVLVKTDFRNAYGSIYRSAIFAAVDKNCPVDSSNIMRWYLNTHMCQESTYLASDGSVHSYNRGVAQGSPLSTFLFCNAVHNALQLACDTVNGNSDKSRCVIAAYADDTNIIGPPDIALKAADAYARAVAPLGIVLQAEKSVILATTPQAAAKTANAVLHLNFPEAVYHTNLLGAPLGSRRSEEQEILDVLDPAIFNRLNLMQDPQSQMLVLRYCIISKFNHLARCCPPDATLEPFNKLKQLVYTALCNILGVQQLPQQALEFAHLPLSLGGLGLTDLRRTREAAYYASAGHALQTWSRTLGATHPIISSWTDADSRSCHQLSSAQQSLREAIQQYNTTKIVPAPIGAPTDADKADPEGAFATPVPPALPNSIKLLRHGSTNLLRFTKIQRELTQVLDIIHFRSLWRNIPADNYSVRCQVLSNIVPSATIWLRLTPENKKFRLEKDDFKITLMQHMMLDIDLEQLLGLPGPDKAPIRCICAVDSFAHHKDNEDDDKNRNATLEHLYNCIHQQAFTTRHSALIQVVVDAAQNVGLAPQLEQAVLKPTLASGNNNQRLPTPRLDVTIGGISADSKLVQCDVSVCSHRRPDAVSKNGVSRNPLYAAKQKVKEKLNKYRDMIYNDSETLVPLVAETSGAAHPNVAKLFATLGARCNNQAPSEASYATPTYTAYYLAVFMCTLRRETARALLRLARAAIHRSGEVSNDFSAPMVPPQAPQHRL